jgi:hypothetical protein
VSSSMIPIPACLSADQLPRKSPPRAAYFVAVCFTPRRRFTFEPSDLGNRALRFLSPNDLSARLSITLYVSRKRSAYRTPDNPDRIVASCESRPLSRLVVNASERAASRAPLWLFFISPSPSLPLSLSFSFYYPDRCVSIGVIRLFPRDLSRARSLDRFAPMLPLFQDCRAWNAVQPR